MPLAGRRRWRTSPYTPCMGRPKRWTMEYVDTGIFKATLASWKYFPDFITRHAELFAETATVWRGQAASRWELRPTLDRLALRRSVPRESARAKQLRLFQLSARGRRHQAGVPLSEDEWWSLGQHYGLATPLLDWSRSPFVALYFAFESDINDGDDWRAVWALNRRNVEYLCDHLLNEDASRRTHALHRSTNG